MRNTNSWVQLFIPLTIAALLWMSCERPTEPPDPNSPPDTKLSNVPKDNDTIFPLATMSWTGGDNDGYVARYQYRYVTYHMSLGSGGVWTEFDSTVWKDTTGTSLTVAFNSSEALNRQVFYVRAIDNTGTVDPTPATKTMFTSKASPPVTRVVTPVKGDTIMALVAITDWWTGMTLTFSAYDQTVHGAVVDYAWSVDGGVWHWGTDTTIAIKPEDFAAPLSGRHYIKVVSRNSTNLIDPVGDSVSFVLRVPTFEKDLLIIDETDEFNYPFITYNIADSTVDNFYARVFPESDSWDYKAHGGMPPQTLLSHYKLIVWHADDRPVSVPHKISDPKNIAVFTDYLKVGGKFLMSGWGILKSFAYYNNFPFSFQPGTFVFDYLHIRTVDETPRIGDCIGGDSAMTAFSSFSVDSVKMAFFPYNGKLGEVNIITSTAGFTVGLYSYKNLPNSQYVSYRGRPLALRYYGTAFDAVVLGFPLYFIREDDAKTMGIQILRNLQVH